LAQAWRNWSFWKISIPTPATLQRLLLTDVVKRLDVKTGCLQLTITAQRSLESSDSRGGQVAIEVRHAAGETLFTGEVGEGEEWVCDIPKTFQGEVQVTTQLTDAEGHVWRGQRTLQTRQFAAPQKKELWKTYRYVDGLAGNAVFRIIQTKDGALWFATNGGVSRFDGKGWRTYTVSDGLGNSVWDIAQDGRGVLWFGGNGGVSRFDGERWMTYTSADGLAGDYVGAVLVDHEGEVWCRTDRGISRFDGIRWQTVSDQQQLTPNKSSSPGAIFQDGRGILWFGGTEGLTRFDRKTNIWQTYTRADGLPDNEITAIAEDGDRTLWIATGRGGVARFDGECFQSLNSRDGLPHDTVLSLCITRAGQIWLGTEDELAQYTPGKSPPSISTTEIAANGERYPNPQGVVSLRPGVRRAAISYRTISFRTRPEAMLYQYQLEGVDKGWRKPTHNETVETSDEYGDLAPGTYTFKVRAVDRDLNYSEPVTVAFEVKPDERDIELARLRQKVSQKYRFENLIGRSAAMKPVRALMEKAIDSGLTVLITGESGTGKELVAKAIHHNSPRKGKSPLELNCGSVPKELVASTLFGHRKGAFTGATEDKMGLFEAASGSTVILDEIGDMPEDAQVHLFRVLQERKVQWLGEFRLRDVDVRVITITNRDLLSDVKAGRFREELYYRLSEFPIHLPPLRERAGDIPLLARHFLEEACREMKRDPVDLAPGVMEMLMRYPWPGNIRELRNEVRRAIALAEGGLPIQTYHFSAKLTQRESLFQEAIAESTGYSEAVDGFKRRLILQALNACGGKVRQTARHLGIDHGNFIREMRRLGISR